MKPQFKALYLSLAFAAMLLASHSQAAPVIKADEVELVPHRAIYEMKLDKTLSGSNVASLTGFLIIEFTGSSCEGYVQNTQLITTSADWAGTPSVTDMRSSSWEDGEGKTFRFHSTRYFNEAISEVIEGKATRDASSNSITLSLKQPAANTARIPGNAMFPTQHIIAILKSAREGKFVLQADLYDGLDKGDKIYQTNTVIGKPIAPGAGAVLPPLDNSGPLDLLISWPVSVSYFERDKDTDTAPTYEIAYRLYANGVSRKLQINYGNFSVDGELTKIEFLKPSECNRTPHKPVRR